MISKRITLAMLATAAFFFVQQAHVSSAQAQANRNIGAQSFIMDDGLGHFFTMQAPAGMTGPLTYQFPLPPVGATAGFVSAGTAAGQTLFWNAAAGHLDWEPSNIITNNNNGDGTNVTIAAPLITTSGLTNTGLFTQTGALNLAGSSSPIQVDGSAGVANNFMVSTGAGNTPTWRNLLAADIPAGSNNYIQNQNAGPQTADFNISGNGTLGGNLSVTGTSTLTGLATANNFASSGAVITGGSISNAPVGAGGASTGDFTALTASTSETFSNLATAGLVHNAAGGLLSTGLLVNADITPLTIQNGSLQNSAINLTYGTGISGPASVSLGGTANLDNTGVTSNVAGNGITVSGATGAVTITNAAEVSTASNVLFAASGPQSFSGTGAITLDPTLSTQVANTVLAGPTTGPDAQPTFRALVAADIPAGSNNYIQNQNSGPQTADFNISGAGAVGSGFNIAGGNLLIGGTSVIDATRNLINIGNLSLSGSIGTATTISSTGNATIATAASTNNTFGNGANATNNIGTGSGSTNNFGNNAANNQFGAIAGVNTYGDGSTQNQMGANSGPTPTLNQLGFATTATGATTNEIGKGVAGSTTSTTIGGGGGTTNVAINAVGWSMTAPGALSIANTGSETFANLATAGIVHNAAGGALSTSAVNLASADVTGILPIANGGTGSNVQNFVDLTTNQSVAGNKTFTGTTTANTFASSGATITGGSINGTPVGATTQSTGAFTTLSASSTTTLAATNITGTTTQTGALNLAGATSPLQVGGSAGAANNFMVSAGAGNTPTWRNIVASDIPAGSGNYIQNQNAGPQTADFNISGNGTLGGNLSVTGTSTLTGLATANTFASSGATITGGSINGTPVGATTQSTGAFTTLASSGNSTIGTAAGTTNTFGNGANGTSNAIGNNSGATGNTSNNIGNNSGAASTVTNNIGNNSASSGASTNNFGVVNGAAPVTNSFGTSNSDGTLTNSFGSGIGGTASVITNSFGDYQGAGGSATNTFGTATGGAGVTNNIGGSSSNQTTTNSFGVASGAGSAVNTIGNNSGTGAVTNTIGANTGAGSVANTIGSFSASNLVLGTNTVTGATQINTSGAALTEIADGTNTVGATIGAPVVGNSTNLFSTTTNIEGTTVNINAAGSGTTNIGTGTATTNLQGQFEMSGVPGAANDVLTSNGAGLTPSWGSSVTLVNVTATGDLDAKGGASVGGLVQSQATTGKLTNGDLSGAVTTSGSLFTTLAAASVGSSNLIDGSVTYSKIQNVAASSLIGNATGASAAATNIGIGSSLQFTGSNLDAIQNITTTGTPSFGGLTVTPSGTSVGLTITNTGTGNDVTGSSWSASSTGVISAAGFTGPLTGNVTGNVSGSSASFTGALVGDVTGTQGATVVSTVGTSSAANVHSAELLANAATTLNTPSTIVMRDASGNFAAGTITGNVTGNVSGSSASFTGALVGDVTGTQGATVVSTVGTSSAANVHSAELLANAATALNTSSTIVMRDASGNFAAGAITGTSLDAGAGAIQTTGSVTPGTLNGSGSATSVGGAATVNAYAGSVAVNVGETSLTLTDSKISTTSTVIATYQDLAAKGPITIYVTSLASGSAVLTYSAAIPAAANATVNFIVVNP